MKKLIALLLVLVMSASLPVFVQAEDADVSYTEEVLIDYNGDDKLVDNAYGCDFSSVTKEYLDAEYGNTLKNTEGALWLHKGSTNEYTSSLIYEFDYYFPEGGLAKNTYLLYGTFKRSSAKGFIYLYKDGTISMYYPSEVKAEEKLTAGWWNFNITLDPVKLTYDVVITSKSDSDIITSIHADLPENDADSGSKNDYTYGTKFNNGHILDNIKLTYKAKNYKLTSDILDSTDAPVADINEVPYESGNKIKLTFSETMDDTTFTADNIKLTDKAGNPVVYTGTLDTDKKIYTLELGELSPKTEYKLAYKGLKTASGGYAHYTGDAPADPASFEQSISFKTKYPPFSIKAVDLDSTSKTIEIQNTTSKTGKIVIATYTTTTTESGLTYDKLASIYVTVVSANESKVYPVTYTGGALQPEIYLLDDAFGIVDVWEWAE